MKEERKGFICFIPRPLLFIIEGNQSRNLEAGAHAVAMEEYCLLACSPHGLFCLPSFRSQGCLIMDVPTHKRLVLATPITNF